MSPPARASTVHQIDRPIPAAKHGVNGFTKVLYAEYFNLGIRPYVICPGPTLSRMRSESFPTEVPESLIQAEDIADAALFAATQKSTAYTQEIVVNLGQAIRHHD